jgi:phosphatidylinositol glycan class M
MALMYAFWYLYFGKSSSGNLIPSQLKDKQLEELQTNRLHKAIAYAVYGLWVHFRIYPIIFLPLILLYEYRNCKNQSIITLIRNTVSIFLFAGGMFLILLWVFYQLYGEDFLDETYLFHLTRKDNRHSFSPFFYDIYLHYFESKPLRLLPIALYLFLLTVKSSKSFSMFYIQFLITFGFVEFNTVITLQYYQWVFGALLLVLP